MLHPFRLLVSVQSSISRLQSYCFQASRRQRHRRKVTSKQGRPFLFSRIWERKRERERGGQRETERERETNLDARAPQMQKDTDVSLTMRTINVYSTNNENCMHNEATHERSWRSIARFSIDIPEQCEGMEARNSLPPDDEDLFMPFIWRFQMFLILWPKRRTTLREFENLFSPYRRMAFPMKYFQYPSTSLQGFSPSSLGTNDSLWHLASFSFHSLDISAPEQALILYTMWLRLHR